MSHLCIQIHAILALSGPATHQAPLMASTPANLVPRLAILSYSVGEHKYTLQLDVTTIDGKSYTSGKIHVEAQDGSEARDDLLEQLSASGFIVAALGTNKVVLAGVKAKSGGASGVTSVHLTQSKQPTGTISLLGVGKIKVK